MGKRCTLCRYCWREFAEKYFFTNNLEWIKRCCRLKLSAMNHRAVRQSAVAVQRSGVLLSCNYQVF